MDPQTAVQLGLKSVPYVTDNYDKVWDPTKEYSKQGFQAVKKKMRDRRRRSASDSDYDSDDGPRSRSYQNGRRRGSSRGRDGEFVETKRVIRTTSAGRDDRTYRRTRRYSDSDSRSPPRRSSSKRRQSLGQKAMAALGLGAAGGAVASSRRRSYSSSRSRSRSRDYNRRRRRSADYGAVAPSSRGYDDDRTPHRYKPAGYIDGGRDESRGRDSQSLVRRDGRNEAAVKSKRSSSSSSASSSDVCSSSEDERRKKKMVKKEWITAGLAAVATIHAAHGVYSSMEARDKRVMEVMKGEMTPEEARKKKNKARLQDAASIGIAALGIKGAYSEWKEVQEKREEMAELKREKEEHHEKRLRKLEKHGPEYFQRNRGSSQGRNASEPDLGRRRYRSDSR